MLESKGCKSHRSHLVVLQLTDQMETYTVQHHEIMQLSELTRIAIS
jgi:hypothetical protein